MAFIDRIKGYKKLCATLATVAGIWATPLPIEVKIAKTVIVVVAYLTAQGAVDVAEKLANGKPKPEEPAERRKTAK